VFNTVIGEELLFRGHLLPRMNGAFGRWDRTVNGRLFGASHIRQPWTIFGSSILGEFLFALPSKRFRCAWFGILAHSGKSVYLLILILGLVLGFA
jgi:membrane protease YdiL (CAAX protease family)